MHTQTDRSGHNRHEGADGRPWRRSSFVAPPPTDGRPPPSSTSDSGIIDVRDLKVALFAIGQHPSDDDVYVMLAAVRTDG